MKEYDIRSAPIKIYGLCDNFNRLPKSVAEAVKAGGNDIDSLQRMTSGGRARFRTDSVNFEIHVVLENAINHPRSPLCAVSGVDVYADNRFIAAIRPIHHLVNEYKGKANLGEGEKEVDIYFPLLNGVKEISIFLDDGAAVLPPVPYSFEEKPVVFYGSSIVHGDGAARPSSCYPSVVARYLDCNFINLGLCGRAHGDIPIAEYIASLSPLAFVYDYDHNAQSAEEIKNKHKPFFDVIRRANPDMPIVICTDPDVGANRAREDIRCEIMKTYICAKAEGDNHVYFCDGKAACGYFERDNYTIDGLHPNDAGYFRVAEGVLRELMTDSLFRERKKI